MDQSRFWGALKSPKTLKNLKTEEKKGFTIIEVMIFLAISGLLLIGVFGGTYRAIATQRYNDSVRSFAEFLRQVYAEVISPESIGATDGSYGGNSNDFAIYGKVIVFGTNDQSTIYTATLVGSPDIPSGNQNFVTELDNVQARLFCGIEEASTITHESTVDSYTPLWETEIHTARSDGGGILKGTVIIARSPTSGTIHTVYNPDLELDLSAADGCQPGAGNQKASDQLRTEIHNDVAYSRNNFQTTDIDFCIKSEQSNFVRDVVLAADGRNNTAVNLLDDSEGSIICR